jgi:hypothetical protein
VAPAVAWGFFVPVFGMTQAAILPGDRHWIVQVAHLPVGLIATGRPSGSGWPGATSRAPRCYACDVIDRLSRA